MISTSLSFAQAKAPFIDSGFPVEYLHPVIPPDAALSGRSRIQWSDRGKQPGRYLDSRVWCGLKDWAKAGLPEKDRAVANDWPTGNIGLRAKMFPAIDIDTSTPDALALVEALVKERFGADLAARTRGDAPRVLYPFRLAEDRDCFRKHKVEWTDSAGNSQAIDILADGQQYVVAGKHPSGAEYVWRGGRLPNAKTLPEISIENVDAFVAALRLRVKAAGGTRFKVTGGGKRSRDAVKFSNADPQMPPELALEALRAIPNDEDTVPTREKFLALLSSVKAALGRHAEEYRDAVHEWSVRAAPEFGYGGEDFEKIWDSICSSHVGADHLVQTARRFGWRGDAALDFAAEDAAADMEKIAAVEAAAAKVSGDALRAMADKLVRIPSERVFIELGTRSRFTNEALNEWSKIADIAKQGTRGKKSAAHRLLPLVREVRGETFLVGEEPVVNAAKNDMEEALYHNRWRANEPPLPDKVTDDDARPWLEHVAFLFPDEHDRGLLLDYLAHVVQRRGKKIAWAPLLKGNQGVGKDLLMLPLAKFFGDENYRSVKASQMMARFTGYLESEFIACVELKVTDRTRDLYEHLKELIAPTADAKVTVERKGIDAYQIENRANFIFFSNHDNPILLDRDERRFFVLASDAERRAPEYYQRLVAFYERGGWQKVVAWLKQRDISAFNAFAPPPMTEGKRAILEAQRSPLSYALEEALSQSPLAARVAVTSKEVSSVITSDVSLARGVLRREEVTPWSVAQELKALGWHLLKGIKVDRQVLSFFVRPGSGASLTEVELKAEVRADYVKAQAAKVAEWDESGENIVPFTGKPAGEPVAHA